MTENCSAIFTGHRPLGYVSNHVPLVTRYITRRKEHLIVTVTGRTFHTYGSSKLGLLTVSKIHPENITALTADSHLVFVAAGQKIYAWRRGNELQRIYSGHETDVHILYPFGPKLISIDQSSMLKVWDIKDGSEYLEMTFNNTKTKITALCHPSTYLDKILIGSKQGHLQLWNLKSTKLIYTFEGWNSGVVCLEQAPAIDVVAIGLESGEVYVHNLKYDESVIKFSQDWGPVTTIAFRTDGQPLMMTGSPVGHIACWDLERRKLAHQLKSCHVGSVAGMKCLQGEPLLVTNSGDNTLKQWIFDMSDGGGRLLRQREGHSQPPSKIRYYGSSGQNVLSAGQDSSLRVFSTVADLLNRSLGHASFNRKLSKKHRVSEDPVRMPPIMDFTSDTSRDREWDNIACVHRQQGLATTWSFGNSKMGSLQLLHDRFKQDPELKDAVASCICLTSCGNFVVLGYSSGHVDRFNIQSGIHRGTYNHGKKPAHKNPVRGVATDSLNQQIVTADSKGIVKFWRFKAGQLLQKLVMGQDLSMIRLHRDSGLLAIAMEDFSIRVIDIDTRCLVRKFHGHQSAITDISLSVDSRWLVSVSMDRTARVWDLPTGQCVDYVEFDKPATSVDLSPSSDMMATSHVDDLGIYLWVNKTVYEHVTLAPINKKAKPVKLSLPQNLNTVLEDDVPDEDSKMESAEPEEEYASPEQISTNMITLANLPGSRWLNLLSLDVIKAKNKPKAPPKKPSVAPFFLPTIQGLETKFDLSKLPKESEDNSRSLQLSFTSFTEFGAALGQASSREDYLAMIDSLMEKGPSAIDLEIRSVGPEGGGTIGSLCQFLEMLKVGLETNSNFEALESYLGLFMKVHGETISTEKELMKVLEDIKTLQDEKWCNLQTEIDSCLCLTTFFKSSFL